MRSALQMSMQEEAALASGDNADMSKVLGDQSFLSSILSSVSLFSLPNAWDSFEITGIYSMFSLYHVKFTFTLAWATVCSLARVSLCHVSYHTVRLNVSMIHKPEVVRWDPVICLIKH